MRSPAVALVLSVLAAPAAAQLDVVSLSPGINASNVAPNAQIVVDFDRAVDPATLPPSAAHFHISGNVTGPIAGTLALENGDQRLRFTPTKPFEAGEIVSVELDRFVQAADATFLRSGGWSWSFRVRAGVGLRSFVEIDSMVVRTTPSVSARVYGGGIADFDRDGWLDIAGVCEDSQDVRMFLNQGDGRGFFDPFLPTTFPTGTQPSPNEHVDFDGDGFLDIVTANTGGVNVSVLLGNGDGTFDPRTDYTVGSGPHGIAVLDVDGDGDLDIATSNTGASNVAILRNDGAGAFGSLSTFDGGGSGEYGIAAGDFDNDGLTDLVVGTNFDSRAIVHLSNGDGTFAMQPFVGAGGSVWMMQTGDLNNDGNLDVSCANGASGNGSVLLGNGLGGLGAPQVLGGGSYAVATDLGDLDGDGDLDWVVSFFGSGEFRLNRNTGAGAFVFETSFDSDSNGSCAALYDIDHDRDLDMLLFDEIADTIRVMRNLNSPFQQVCQAGVAGVIACPCGNPPSGAPRGCQNSASTGGAILTASGSASLAADTVVFTTSGEKPTALSVVLQGNAIEPSGRIFGQGVRCVGGALKRLYVKSASGGSITAPVGADPKVSVRSAALGSAILAGQHRWVMVYYRDPIVLGGCPVTSTFNGTGTVDVSWGP